MKKLFYLFIRCSIIFLMLPYCNAKEIKYKRMVILLDPDRSELTMPESLQALSSSLALSLAQKNFAILSSSTPIQLFLQDIPDPSQPFHHLYNKQMFYRTVNFKPQEWNIFHITSSDFFLFIPKQIMSEYSNGDQSVLKFDSSILKEFTSATLNEFSTWIKKSTPAHPQNFDVAMLYRFFHTQQDTINQIEKTQPTLQQENFEALVAQKRSELTPWNFYIVGHGSYEDEARNLVGSVAGLQKDKLNDLLHFFNTQLSVHVAAITSCYSGGKNLNLLHARKSINQEWIRKLHFTLAVISSTDAPTTTSWGISYLGSHSNIDWSRSSDINTFFTNLDRKPGKQSDPNWLTDALYALALPLTQPENIPQILVPRGEWFEAFTSVNPKRKVATAQTIAQKEKWTQDRKKTIILGKALIKKYEIENKILNLSDAKNVLLSEPVIPIAINIDGSKPMPQFISRIPGDTSHIFKKIVITNQSKPMKSYLQELFLGSMKSTEAQKVFFIDDLGSKHVLITTINDQFGLQELDSKNPEYKKYSKPLTDYFAEKPTWKKILRPTKSQLQVKLNDAQDRLSVLKSKLSELKKILNTLQSSLTGKTPFTATPTKIIPKEYLSPAQKTKIKEWNIARDKLYSIINVWMKRAKTGVFTITHQDIINYGSYLSLLPTDDKINAGTLLISRLSRTNLRMLADSAINLAVTQSNQDLAGFSIQLAKELSSYQGNDQSELNLVQTWLNSKQNWINKICNDYYMKTIRPKQRGKTLLPHDYYLAAELCVLLGSIVNVNHPDAQGICQDLFSYFYTRKDSAGKEKDFINDSNLIMLIAQIVKNPISQSIVHYFKTDPNIQEILSRNSLDTIPAQYRRAIKKLLPA